MRRLLSCIPLLALTATQGSLFALQGDSIFIKAVGGGGYTIVSESAEDIKLNFKGVSGIGMLQIGGSLSRSIKIFGFSGISVSPSPSVTTQNLKIDTTYSNQSIFDLGIGIGYYAASGLFVSAGGSIAQSYYKFDVYGVDVGTYTRHGWGSHLMFGKEFSLSKHWSYGVSALGYYGQVYDVGEAPFANATVTNLYFGLVVSVMYD